MGLFNLFRKKYVPEVPSIVNLGIKPKLNPSEIEKTIELIDYDFGNSSKILINPLLFSRLGGGRRNNFIFFFFSNIKRSKLLFSS